MKKKLLLPLLFILMAIGSSYSQINADFLKKEKKYALVNYSQQLPNLSLLDYDTRLNSPTMQPSDNVFCVNNLGNSNNDVWLGQETQTTVMFHNIPIQTNYQFDIQGRFQSSSMSISLSK